MQTHQVTVRVPTRVWEGLNKGGAGASLNKRMVQLLSDALEMEARAQALERAAAARALSRFGPVGGDSTELVRQLRDGREGPG